MIPGDLLELLFHRPLTNIKFTSTYPLEIYTHYLSKTQFAILAIDVNGIYTERERVPLIFAKDASGNEYPYNLYSFHGMSNMFCAILQWTSPCLLTFRSDIAFAQSKEHINNPTTLIKYSIITLLYNPSLLNLLNDILMEENAILLDNLDVDLLWKISSNSTLTRNSFTEQVFKCTWQRQTENFNTPISCTSFQSIPIRDTSTSVDYLFYNPLHILNTDTAPVRNCLDAIVISTFHKEITSGILTAFLNQMLNALPDTDRYSQVLYIIYNREITFASALQEQLERCRSIFSNVELINIQIPPALDVYYRSEKGVSYKPLYGHASGPNYAFFKTMRMLKSHNTVLQLEADCIVQPGWLRTCIDYVAHTGQFLVAGALNDGETVVESIMLNHINGVAFYNVGSPLFQELLNMTEQFILCGVRYTKNFYWAYDYTMRQCIDTYMNTYTNIPDLYRYYRYFHRMMLHTSLIANALDNNGPKKTADEYMRLYNAVIVHIK